MVNATKSLNGACAAALTLNERGAEDAMQTDVDEMVFVVSATEGHSQANTRRSRKEALELAGRIAAMRDAARSDEHTSELQSLMSISYAVFCLNKNKDIQ